MCKSRQIFLYFAIKIELSPATTPNYIVFIETKIIITEQHRIDINYKSILAHDNHLSYK